MRRGTRIWAATDSHGLDRAAAGVRPPLDPPASGVRPPLDPPASGGKTEGTGPLSLSGSLPACGEGWGGGWDKNFTLVPVEHLQPGIFLLGPSGQLHPITRIFQKQYQGQIVSLQHPRLARPLWLSATQFVLARRRPRSLGGQRDWSGVPLTHLDARKRLRREATPSERRLWAGLKGQALGLKFRRQHPLGPYIADFYCREAALVVEVDGGQHFTREGIHYDRERDAHLRAVGLEVLRFSNGQIERQLDAVLHTIAETCWRRTESLEGAEWVEAGALAEGDWVFRRPMPPLDPPAAGVRPPLDPPASGGKTEGTGPLSPSGSLPACGEGWGGGKGIRLTAVDSHFTHEDLFSLVVAGAAGFATEACFIAFAATADAKESLGQPELPAAAASVRGV